MKFFITNFYLPSLFVINLYYGPEKYFLFSIFCILSEKALNHKMTLNISYYYIVILRHKQVCMQRKRSRSQEILIYIITSKLIHKIIKFCVITNKIFEKDYYETFLKIQKINISMCFSGYNLTQFSKFNISIGITI